MAANDEELSPEDMGRLLNGTREDIMELLDTKKVRTEEGELEDWDVNTLVISDVGVMSLIIIFSQLGSLIVIIHSRFVLGMTYSDSD